MRDKLIVEKKLLNGIYISLYTIKNRDDITLVQLHDKDLKYKGAFLNTCRGMESDKATNFYNECF